MEAADLRSMFDLAAHGPDVFVGVGPRYPWRGLYGGQIVAQGLRAAAATADPDLGVHSLRAYFIRPGDHTEPVRYEVDRIRNGRSFATRRVVARQAIGAILNLEASFQRNEPTVDLQTITAPAVTDPEALASDAWSTWFERRFVPAEGVKGERDGAGRTVAWLRLGEDVGDDELLQACAFAWLSDDLPTDAVVRAVTGGEAAFQGDFDERWFSASLDHAIWFHRPLRADRWHLHDFSCHRFGEGRGLSIGHVFSDGGEHAATVAQEVLLRERR